VLRIVEAPLGRPGREEALVRIVAAAINPADLAFIGGRYGVRPQLPATPGFEAAGVVEEVGEGVADLHPGDRVILALGAGRGQGTWRSHLVAPAAALLPTPERLSDQQAGAALVTSLTALALLDLLALPAGSALLVTAPWSSTGIALGQLAETYGLRLFGLARRPMSAPPGYHAVAVWPAWQELDEGRFAAALDCVAGEWTAACLEAVEAGGEVVTYGALSGQSGIVDPEQIIYGEKRLRGFWLHRWLAAASPLERDARYALALAYLGAGNLDPVVARAFPLNDVQSACRFASEPGRVGKVVLLP
jgi:NADPH:quinone reductase-like Zn-dependent oxidoreductase